MTHYELITTLVAVLATVLSFISLARTRKFNDLQRQLTELSTDLAQRHLARLVTDELLMGQPRFAVREVSMSGLGDPRSPLYRVKVKFRVENIGEPVLESSGVNLVVLKDGAYIANARARLERTELRDQPFDVVGEHTITLTPPVDLTGSFLHIRYVDSMGRDKIAQFQVFLEGPPSVLPSHVFFNFHQLSTLVPATAWHFKPDN
jgi:hypothetical protein